VQNENPWSAIGDLAEGLGGDRTAMFYGAPPLGATSSFEFGRRVSYAQFFDGCYASWREIGRPLLSGGASKTVPVDVWAFADGLIVTPAPSSWTRLLPRRWRPDPNGDGVTREAILDAYPKAVQLDRDTVQRVHLQAGSWRKWARIGVENAVFEFNALSEFDLLVDRWRADEFASLLQQVYGSRFHA
jgi:hypothetical protein